MASNGWTVPVMNKIRNITGQRFGRLIALYDTGDRLHKSVVWLLKCDCGNTHKASMGNLRQGYVTSCGCLYKEINGSWQTTHGMHLSKTYRSWASMIQRCNNKNNSRYHRYGGRGITVCGSWLNSFENFLSDMGERPKGMTLDRYPNNDGNYESSNCRWATPAQQANNRRKPCNR